MNRHDLRPAYRIGSRGERVRRRGLRPPDERLIKPGLAGFCSAVCRLAVPVRAGHRRAPSPDSDLFTWKSYTREGHARLVNSTNPQHSVRLATVAPRRCINDKAATTAADAKAIVAGSDLSRRIAADLRKGKLSYAELNRACVQEFEAALGGGRKQAIRTIFWRFARYDAPGKEDATRDLWSVFVRDGAVFKPRYLTSIFDPHDVPSDLYEVLAVGDLTVVRYVGFEMEDTLLILSWEKSAPVIVHDSDDAFP